VEELINVLKQRREALGITQAQLAQVAGISLRTLKALESHKANPRLNTLLKLTKVLGLAIKLTPQTI